MIRSNRSGRASTSGDCTVLFLIERRDILKAEVFSITNNYIFRAIELATKNVETGVGGPFAALIVRDDKVIAEGTNTVTNTNDPTAHAEVNAIRAACSKLQNFDLTGCDLYASCEPCPMCLGACYWSRIGRIFYAATRADATAAGFNDTMIYEELTKSPADRCIPTKFIEHAEAARPFQAWRRCPVRREY